jgi:hypothetical protein
MTEVKNTRLNGLMNRNSLTLLIVLAIQFLEKNLLKEYLVLKEHQLTLVTNISHSSRLLAWTLMLLLTSNMVRQFTKTQKLLNGLVSGRL